MNIVADLIKAEQDDHRQYAELVGRCAHPLPQVTAADGKKLQEFARRLMLRAADVADHVRAAAEVHVLLPAVRPIPTLRKSLQAAIDAAANHERSWNRRCDEITEEKEQLRRAGNSMTECVQTTRQRIGQHERTTNEEVARLSERHKELLAAVEAARAPLAEAEAALARIHTLRGQFPKVFEHLPIDLPE